MTDKGRELEEQRASRGYGPGRFSGRTQLLMNERPRTRLSEWARASQRPNQEQEAEQASNHRTECMWDASSDDQEVPVNG